MTGGDFLIPIAPGSFLRAGLTRPISFAGVLCQPRGVVRCRRGRQRKSQVDTGMDGTAMSCHNLLPLKMVDRHGRLLVRSTTRHNESVVNVLTRRVCDMYRQGGY